MCKKRDPHLFHKSEVIKISNSIEDMKKFVAEKSKQLEENIIGDESFIYMKNFESFFSDCKNSIKKNYENMLKDLEEIKEKEIDYLIYFHEKTKLEEKYKTLNGNIADLIKDFDAFYEDEKSLKKNINLRKEIVKKYDIIAKNHNTLKQYFNCFSGSIKEMENFNKNLNNKITQYHLRSKELFERNNSLNKISKYSTENNYSKFIIYF